MDHVETEAHLVRAVVPGNIVAGSPALVVTPERHPVGGLAEAGVTRNVEDGEAALPRVGTIGSRYPQVQSDVLTIKAVGAVLAHARKSEDLIEEQMRCEDDAVPDRRHLDARGRSSGAAVAQSGPARRTQSECAIYQCLHDAVLEEEVMVLRPVPIHFCIEVVPV